MAVVVVRVVVRSCKVVDFILIMYFVVNLFLHVILVCVNEIYFENVVSKIKSSNFNIVEIYITNIFFLASNCGCLKSSRLDTSLLYESL